MSDINNVLKYFGISGIATFSFLLLLSILNFSDIKPLVAYENWRGISFSRGSDSVVNDYITNFLSKDLINNADFYLLGSYNRNYNSGYIVSGGFKYSEYISIPIIGNIYSKGIHYYIHNIDKNEYLDLVQNINSKYRLEDFVLFNITMKLPNEWSEDTLRIVVLDNSSKVFPIDLNSLNREPDIEYYVRYNGVTESNAWIGLGTPYSIGLSDILKSKFFLFNGIFYDVQYMLFIGLILFIGIYSLTFNFSTFLNSDKKKYYLVAIVFIVSYLINIIHIYQYKIDWRPGGDEIRAIIHWLYIPLKEGLYKEFIYNIFVFEGEHVIVVTKVFSLFLILLFGQWNSHIIIVIQSIVPSLTAALYAYVIAFKTDFKQIKLFEILLLILCVSYFILPGTAYSSFLNHYYFLNFFSILTIFTGAFIENDKKYLIGILTIGFLANVSMGTGFISTLIAGFLVLFKYLFIDRKSNYLFMSIMSLIISVYYFLQLGFIRYSLTRDDARYANSLGEFLKSTFKGIATPGYPDYIVIFLLTWIPLIIVTALLLLKKIRINNTFLFSLGLYMWVFANSAANAISRGAEGIAPYIHKYDILFTLYAATLLVYYSIPSDFYPIIIKRLKIANVSILIIFLLVYYNTTRFNSINIYAYDISIFNSFNKSFCIAQSYGPEYSIGFLENNNRRIGGSNLEKFAIFTNEHVYKILPKSVTRCDYKYNQYLNNPEVFK